MESKKMIQVKVVEEGHKVDDEAVLELVENGFEYEVEEIYRDDDPEFTEAPELADDDYDSIRFESKDVETGFVKCGEGLLDGEEVTVYYVVDMDNTELNDAMFILR